MQQIQHTNSKSEILAELSRIEALEEASMLEKPLARVIREHVEKFFSLNQRTLEIIIPNADWSNIWLPRYREDAWLCGERIGMALCGCIFHNDKESRDGTRRDGTGTLVEAKYGQQLTIYNFRKGYEKLKEALQLAPAIGVLCHIHPLKNCVLFKLTRVDYIDDEYVYMHEGDRGSKFTRTRTGMKQHRLCKSDKLLVGFVDENGNWKDFE